MTAGLSSPAAPAREQPDWRVVAAAAVLLIGGALYVAGDAGGRQAALYLLGGALGLVLYHAAFGFSSTWRIFLSDGRGAGLRAQMLMLALATAVFLPVLTAGTLFGQPVGGAYAPLGVSVLTGAFLFGIGMQLGGGCASGTLYTVGGGSTRMVVVLVFFMAGSLIGSAHLPWWLARPSLGTVSLLQELGLAGALGLQLAVFALIAGATVVIERRRHGRLLHGSEGMAPGWRRALAGPWPLIAGAVALALLNVATLGLAGHPWTVAFGYTLWGGKLATAAGLDLSTWEFWTWRYPSRALADSVFANTTATMNFGIVVGAFLAAGLAGRFNPVWALPWGSLLAAAVGGLLMGYGARLAFGCNIGAFFSGIASGSLHGWLWFASALGGSYLVIALRRTIAAKGAPP
jgi:uncharacterized membrane protein YedE/YeeE